MASADSESEMGEDLNVVYNAPRIWIAVHDAENYEHFHRIQEFSQRFGPINRLNINSRPIDYFNRLTSTRDGANLFDILVSETNRYATQHISTTNLSNRSRSNVWNETNYAEMSAFISLVLAMGVVKKPSIESYWNTRDKTCLFHTPNFAAVMTRNRFQLLLQYLHCNNNDLEVPRGRPNHDLTHKIRPVLDLFNNATKTSYGLARDITIDESIVGFKGRNRIVQYMPAKKSHRWGPKFFVLAESETGYTYHIKVYAGKNHTAGRTHPLGLGYEVCTELMDPLLGKYHHLVVDNFFSSPALCQFLYNNNTYMTSTVKTNRKGMPKSLSTARVPKGEMMVKQSGSMMVMKYADRRDVTMLSAFSTPVMEVHENSRGVERDIPAVNHLYNKLMGGVDLADSKVQTYDPDFRSVKMWKKIFINILLRIVVNAYIIYEQTRGPLRKKISRLQFTMVICEELVADVQTGRSVQNGPRFHQHERLTGRHFTTYVPDGKRKTCKVCRKKSRFMCRECAWLVRRGLLCKVPHHVRV